MFENLDMQKIIQQTFQNRERIILEFCKNIEIQILDTANKGSDFFYFSWPECFSQQDKKRISNELQLKGFKVGMNWISWP